MLLYKVDSACKVENSYISKSNFHNNEPENWMYKNIWSSFSFIPQKKKIKGAHGVLFLEFDVHVARKRIRGASNLPITVYM